MCRSCGPNVTTMHRVSISPRAFVQRSTRLQPVPGAEWIRLHLADDAMALWQATRELSGDPDEPIPFWGIAWGGGLAIASYLRDHPDVAAGKRVLDLGSGSGLCAIAAGMAGASLVTAVDVDRFAIAAIGINARANHQRVGVVADDLLQRHRPDVDLVLAGDCWYEDLMGQRATTWLRRAWLGGIDVLLGDPGRRYLPAEGLDELATYEVRSTANLEDLGRNRAWVRTFPAALRSTR
jgi:predicted nicotinamide N-methyase